jgi:TIR domain
MPTVFISHASEDKKLANAFTTLLVTGVDIARREIRNTSDHRNGLAKASLIATSLRKDIENCDFFIPLITPRSLQQPWVLIEIGAAWGLEKAVWPVLFARRKI